MKNCAALQQRASTLCLVASSMFSGKGLKPLVAALIITLLPLQPSFAATEKPEKKIEKKEEKTPKKETIKSKKEDPKKKSVKTEEKKKSEMEDQKNDKKLPEKKTVETKKKEVIKKTASKKETKIKKPEVKKKDQEKDEASTPVVIEKNKFYKIFGEWGVFSTIKNGKKVCYIASVPQKTTTNNKYIPGEISKKTTTELSAKKPKGEPYFIATYLKDNVFEISASSGYTYKPGSEVIVRIYLKANQHTYKLVPNDNIAWTSIIEDDFNIFHDLKQGVSMEVVGIGDNSNFDSDDKKPDIKTSTEVYSLNGVAAAVQYLTDECLKE